MSERRLEPYLWIEGAVREAVARAACGCELVMDYQGSGARHISSARCTPWRRSWCRL